MHKGLVPHPCAAVENLESYLAAKVTMRSKGSQPHTRISWSEQQSQEEELAVKISGGSFHQEKVGVG